MHFIAFNIVGFKFETIYSMTKTLFVLRLEN